MYFVRLHPNLIHIVGDYFEEILCFVGFWFFVINRRFYGIFRREWKRSCNCFRFGIVLGVMSAIFCGIVLPMMIIYMLYFEGA